MGGLGLCIEVAIDQERKVRAGSGLRDWGILQRRVRARVVSEWGVLNGVWFVLKRRSFWYMFWVNRGSVGLRTVDRQLDKARVFDWLVAWVDDARVFDLDLIED
ncbi:hypothetical protein LguiB_012485 [Lonicera macranthoides]